MKNRKNNKKVYGLIVLLLILSMSIGYAYLSQELKLDTTITIPPEKENILIYQLIDQAIEDRDINYGAISSDTNGKGVYKLTKIETSTPIYYYRGAVDNNNVIFGGFCWKMIRTTETKGVKLIYNGVPNSGVCDATGTNTQIGTSAFNTETMDSKYVGYMYDNNTVDSTVKKVVDTWFAGNLLSYQDYLEDTPFYNERDYIRGGDHNQMLFAPRVRIWQDYSEENLNPAIPLTTIKLGAANSEDIFTVSDKIGNGALTYPVGLITSDEIIMAGGRGYTRSDYGTNTNFYLYTGQNFWSLSPQGYMESGWGASIVDLYGVGHVLYHYVNNIEGVRPVVSLKPNIKYLRGEGTKNSPYIINE